MQLACVSYLTRFRRSMRLNTSLGGIRKTQAESSGFITVDKRLNEDSGFITVDKRANEDSGFITVDKRVSEDSGFITVDKRVNEDSGFITVDKRVSEDSGFITVDKRVEEESGFITVDKREPDLRERTEDRQGSRDPHQRNVGSKWFKRNDATNDILPRGNVDVQTKRKESGWNHKDAEEGSVQSDMQRANKRQ